MKLPDHFQFRVATYPGYTHSTKRNAHGDYEVKWARGWHKIKQIEWTVCTGEEVQGWVGDRGWIIVEEPSKQDDVSLPDEFYFQYQRDDTIYKATRIDEREIYDVWWDSRVLNELLFDAKDIRAYIKTGAWKILDKKPLSPEDQRRKKDFEEQVQQLNSAIKLNEQTIEHHERLISNYKARQQDLQDMIKKLEGV